MPHLQQGLLHHLSIINHLTICLSTGFQKKSIFEASHVGAHGRATVRVPSMPQSSEEFNFIFLIFYRFFLNIWFFFLTL